MDELIAYGMDDPAIGDEYQMYKVSDVDAYVEKLKDKIRQKDFFWEGCGFAKMGFKNTIQVAEYIEKLQHRIRELQPTRTEIIQEQNMLRHYAPSEAALKQAKELERLLDIHNQRRFALDMQAPICVSPESAMQVKEPFITEEMERVYVTAPKPDPTFDPNNKDKGEE